VYRIFIEYASRKFDIINTNIGKALKPVKLLRLFPMSILIIFFSKFVHPMICNGERMNYY